MIRKIDVEELKDFNEKFSDLSMVHYFGYFDLDVVVGYIEYYDLYENIDIGNIFVKEDYRNRGIGSLLLERLIIFAKEKGKVNITLEVNVLNKYAIRLYEKYGFKKVAIRKGYYKGIDGYLMELML